MTDGARAAVALAVEELRTGGALDRIWARDASVWTDDAAEQAVCRDRLGWLDVNETMTPHLPRVTAFAETVRAEGVRHVVLCGMGGSSLAPEVFAQVVGSRPGYPDLIVVDTTDPLRIGRLDDRVDWATTLCVISSKSGGTLETDCLRRHVTARLAAAGVSPPGSRLVAVTDPGSSLGARAREENWSAVFENPPDIGGRFSALSLFGLVPAALIGVDLAAVLSSARREATRCAPGSFDDATAPDAVRLGAAFGGLARAGRDKLTLLCSPSTSTFADWVEQLVAESTGKRGLGIVPVVDETLGAPRGGDRQYLQVALQGEPCPTAPPGSLPASCLLAFPSDLGAAFFRLEMATAIASVLLHVEPFDQPDVESAKKAAQEALAAGGREGAEVAQGRGFALDADAATRERLGVAASASGAGASAWLAALAADEGARAHLGLLTYVPDAPAHVARLAELRAALARRTGGATTSSVGPRYLHSSGQLHKGGPALQAFLLLEGEPAGAHDLPIPGKDLTFDKVFRAQAEGDARALVRAGRTLLRVRLSGDVDAALRSLIDAIA